MGLSLLLCGVPALARPQQAPAVSPAPSGAPGAPEPAASSPEQSNEQSRQQTNQQADPRLPGNISGVVVDPSGAAVSGAHVVLTREDKAPKQEVQSGDDGQFSFAGVPPGSFQITVSSELFTTQKVSAILHPGENLTVPQIVFALATAVSQVQVSVPRFEVAEEELKAQEKQRIFGVDSQFLCQLRSRCRSARHQTKISARLAKHDRSRQLCNHWSHRRSAAGYQHPQRIRPGRARLRQTLRRVVRRLGIRHVHRWRDFSFPAETGSPLFL